MKKELPCKITAKFLRNLFDNSIELLKCIMTFQMQGFEARLNRKRLYKYDFYLLKTGTHRKLAMMRNWIP